MEHHPQSISYYIDIKLLNLREIHTLTKYAPATLSLFQGSLSHAIQPRHQNLSKYRILPNFLHASPHSHLSV
jgi:hypothetical protein